MLKEKAVRSHQNYFSLLKFIKIINSYNSLFLALLLWVCVCVRLGEAMGI